MANSLVDILRQNMSMAQPGGPSDTTQSVAALLRAKSGKAVGPRQSLMSSQGEKAALAETNAQLAGVRAAAGQQGQQLLQAEQNLQRGEELARADIGLQRQGQEQQFQQKQQQLFNTADRERQQLEFDELKAQAEQRASDRSLSDKKYVSDLQRVMALARANNEAGFKMFSAERALGNKTALLRQILGDKSELLTQGRLNKQEIAKIDLNYAMQIANQEMADTKQAGMWSSAGGVTNAAISAYGTQQSGGFDSEYQKYRDDGGAKGYQSYKEGEV